MAHGVDDEHQYAVEDGLKRYDPDKIYTRASDEKGHVVNTQVPMPLYLKSAMAGVVNDSRTPFRTMNDAHRDAAFHWMVYWQERLGEDCPPIVHVGIALAEHERQEEQARMVGLLLEKLEEEARHGIADRSVFEWELNVCAQQATGQLRAQVESLRARALGS